MAINIIFAFTYVKCSFQLKYLATAYIGISDYVMEKLFCSVLGSINVQDVHLVLWWCDVHNRQET